MNSGASAHEIERARRRAASTPRFAGFRSLVTRILMVNLVAILALAGALFYIESFRARLLETREQELLAQGEVMAHFLAIETREAQQASILGITSWRGTHVRLYDAEGALIADNWDNPENQRFRLVDPTTAGFRRQSAIAIDRIVDFLIGQPERLPFDAKADREQKLWPEVHTAARTGKAGTEVRQTANRLVVLQAAVPVGAAAPGGQHAVVLLTVDTPDVVDLVRRERMTSFLVFLVVLGSSLILSLYLGRTIVVPLRQLALAAHRVRLGRQRDVVVPRLPHRRDEIGGLARALADMTAALRQRIDATESFAADVAHELKNPLASIRSAVEALGSVRDEEGRAQLFNLIADDVRRIDRLITDISAASRLDAELSRARLQPVDVGRLIEGLVAAQTATGPLENGVTIETVLAHKRPALVIADGDRLAQVFVNLIDNAASFSPAGGVIRISLVVRHGLVIVQVEDEGPGVPGEARDAIFERFYSERPDHEDYGRHSGLGLSIARAIVEALDGDISVTDRPDGKAGAMFVVSLPAA